MSLSFQTYTVQIPDQTGAPTSITCQSNPFNTTVKSADCCIKSWDLEFSDSERPFHRAYVDIKNVSPDNNVVCFTVTAGVRDNSGNWDDTYGGSIDVLVIADVAEN